MDALRTMSFASLANTDVGSLTFAGGQWTLGTSGPQTIGTGMTRTARVQSVSRDASCNVVASGGTTDADSKSIESSVAWTDLSGRARSTTFTALRTQWESPQGTCFATTQGSHVAIDFTTSGQWFGGKQLRQVFVTNSGTSTATIDKIAFTWTNSRQIEQSFFDSTKVWSKTGPGTPSGSQPSGTLLDAQNYAISAGQTVELNKTQFSGAMSGTTITIQLIFTDGSSVTTVPFVPSG